MRPEDRLERLLRHVRTGWQRIHSDPPHREQAVRWLAEHPSSWRELDQLWDDALHDRGPLAAWLATRSSPGAWSYEIPLHSVLSSHPFACLSPWSIESKSSRS